MNHAEFIKVLEFIGFEQETISCMNRYICKNKDVGYKFYSNKDKNIVYSNSYTIVSEELLTVWYYKLLMF